MYGWSVYQRQNGDEGKENCVIAAVAGSWAVPQFSLTFSSFCIPCRSTAAIVIDSSDLEIFNRD